MAALALWQQLSPTHGESDCGRCKLCLFDFRSPSCLWLGREDIQNPATENQCIKCAIVWKAVESYYVWKDVPSVQIECERGGLINLRPGRFAGLTLGTVTGTASGIYMHASRS